MIQNDSIFNFYKGSFSIVHNGQWSLLVGTALAGTMILRWCLEWGGWLNAASVYQQSTKNRTVKEWGWAGNEQHATELGSSAQGFEDFSLENPLGSYIEWTKQWIPLCKMRTPLGAAFVFQTQLTHPVPQLGGWFGGSLVCLLCLLD